MCDTWVALPDATEAGTVILGKNSDRPIFDCQPLTRVARQAWKDGETLRLEYVEVAQVRETYSHLGSGPYWCWGYEEGINEYGVAIGNEAIFTKPNRQNTDAARQGNEPAPGLLGMDLVRLGLERARSAEQAVHVMGVLTEQFGQYGSGVPTKAHADGAYDNSFIVADGGEAWVFETAGRRWAAQRIRGGCTSISNEPTIRSGWDAGSADLVDYALDQGWWPSGVGSAFDFARAYVDDATPRQLSHIRLMRSRQLLAERAGSITSTWMKRIARDHYEDTFLGGPYFDAADPDFLSICMHVSPADFTWGNTASSCVAVLPASHEQISVFWWTPGPPCNGCYVPFFVHGSQLPEIVTRAGTSGKQVVAPPDADVDQFRSESYWWLFRRLLDLTKGDSVRSLPGYFVERNRLVRKRFDLLEAEMEAELNDVLAAAQAVGGAGSDTAASVLDRFSARCVERVVTSLHDLIADFEGGR